MEKKLNEFKTTINRQFGSEQVVFNATVYSEKESLSDLQIEEQMVQCDKIVTAAFKACQEREISEKSLLAAASGRRREEVEKLDQALKSEMEAKRLANETMGKAERLSRKLGK